jgi:hypothetical protein
MKKKNFFFEKKKQKTFVNLDRAFGTAVTPGQKFFGSFFQKRTACFYKGGIT